MTQSVNEPTITHSSALKRSIFLGLFGVDRFYLGDTGLGVGKLTLTLLSFGIYCVPWWIADIAIIANHKKDWDKWLLEKAAKREARLARNQAIIKQQANKKALMKEREEQGLCPNCGSNKVSVVADTYSKTTLGASGPMTLGQVLKQAPGTVPTHEKTKTRMMKVCLNCGFKKEIRNKPVAFRG